jgi:predicted NAD-dependent protein-ADP-ribosyltransferase YbiA (DUF1768 family)
MNTQRGTSMKRILFCRVNERYGELSNFAPYLIKLNTKNDRYWGDGGDGKGITDFLFVH